MLTRPCLHHDTEGAYRGLRSGGEESDHKAGAARLSQPHAVHHRHQRAALSSPGGGHYRLRNCRYALHRHGGYRVRGSHEVERGCYRGLCADRLCRGHCCLLDPLPCLVHLPQQRSAPPSSLLRHGTSCQRHALRRHARRLIRRGRPKPSRRQPHTHFFPDAIQHRGGFYDRRGGPSGDDKSGGFAPLCAETGLRAVQGGRHDAGAVPAPQELRLATGTQVREAAQVRPAEHQCHNFV
mmetsp:Transcript_13538/g.29879  ORF Transcript_13538/g.29879 Transcript_13538/m.29879 type:complete len:238 (-) Transcript_13538:328-1041(-)